MSRRTATAFGAGVTLSVVELALGFGCSDAGQTAGQRVELVTRVKPERLSFVNGYGFRIELERALLSIGPLRYLEGAPVSSSWLRRVFALREAHAHPGHYVEGGTLGELLEPASVDLARGASELGVGAGATGIARSALFSFQDPARGAFADELSGHVVLVEGSARTDESMLRFRIAADVADVLDAEGRPFVAGCPLEDGTITGDGIIELTVWPSLWFDQLDFSELEADADASIEIGPDTLAHRAFVRGLKKAGAYGFAYLPA